MSIAHPPGTRPRAGHHWVTDQVDDGTVGFWAGNRATWPLTGLEQRLPELARLVRDAGLAGGHAGQPDRRVPSGRRPVPW